MKQTSDRGLYSEAGAFAFGGAILMTVSDASWTNDTRVVEREDGDSKIFPKRSQYGRIHYWATQNFGMRTVALYILLVSRVA